jgi:hypothetical protein
MKSNRTFPPRSACWIASLPRKGRQFTAAFRAFWQGGTIPSATQGLDKKHSIFHAAAENVDGSNFVGESRALRGIMVEVLIASVHNGVEISRSASGHDFVIDDSGKTVLPGFVFECRCRACDLGRNLLHSD